MMDCAYGFSAIFRKSKILLFLSVVLLLSDGPIASAPRNTAKISVLIATGMPGSTYYQVGLGMASLWTTRLRPLGIRVSAAISEGSLENIEAIRIADADIILVENFFSSQAYRGTGIYKGRPLKELRSIATLWPDTLHLLIRADKIKTGTLHDLEGLTIATELPDSGNRYLTGMLLNSLKAGKRKVRLRRMNDMAAAEAFREGKVQGIDLMGGLPIPLVASLYSEQRPPVALLNITDSQMEAARREFGRHLFHAVIPTGTYNGQKNSVNTVGQMSVLAVTASLDDDVVYALTKTLYENLAYLAKVHPACRNLALGTALDGLSIPLHRGALRYYRQRKIAIPKHLIR
jgi:uncharacterized protein